MSFRSRCMRENDSGESGSELIEFFSSPFSYHLVLSSLAPSTSPSLSCDHRPGMVPGPSMKTSSATPQPAQSPAPRSPITCHGTSHLATWLLIVPFRSYPSLYRTPCQPDSLEICITQLSFPSSPLPLPEQSSIRPPANPLQICESDSIDSTQPVSSYKVKGKSHLFPSPSSRNPGTNLSRSRSAQQDHG